MHNWVLLSNITTECFCVRCVPLRDCWHSYSWLSRNECCTWCRTRLGYDEWDKNKSAFVISCPSYFFMFTSIKWLSDVSTAYSESYVLIEWCHEFFAWIHECNIYFGFIFCVWVFYVIFFRSSFSIFFSLYLEGIEIGLPAPGSYWVRVLVRLKRFCFIKK